MASSPSHTSTRRLGAGDWGLFVAAVAAIGLEAGVWAFFAANLCLYSSIELTFSLWG